MLHRAAKSGWDGSLNLHDYFPAMNNLLSKRKIWKSPVTPFNRLSLSGREDEDYYDYYYDDEVDRDDKDVSARSRAEVV